MMEFDVNLRSDLEHLEKNVFELNAKKDVSIRTILNFYTKGIERIFPDMQCSIMQVKRNRLFNWASTSLPEAFSQAIEGLEIGSEVGSCGTAAYLKEQVIVTDIRTDYRWAGFSNIALQHGLQACWSYPIVNSSGEVMATFAIYYHEPKEPDEEEFYIITRAASLLQVILENRQYSETLEETTLLMTQGQELAHFGNWLWDISENTVSWSDSLYAIYGQSKNSFKATFEGYLEMLHPDDREMVRSIIQSVLTTGGDCEFEERIIRPTGEIRYLKSWGKLKYDEKGQPLKMIGACLDITESKLIQQELIASESHLRHLLERYTYVNKATNDAIYDWDIRTDHIQWGDSFFRLFGYKTEDEHSTIEKWFEKVHADDAIMVEESFSNALENPTVHNWNQEYRMRRSDGSYLFIEENGYILRDDEGNPIRMIGVLRDITERKTAFQKHLDHIETIEQHILRLREIAWTQSHLVRAPLARIMGIVPLLNDHKTDAGTKETLLSYLTISAAELDGIIKEIINKSQTE
ncbi:PAS domain-containing protein [Arcticibacter tournemirensis]